MSSILNINWQEISPDYWKQQYQISRDDLYSDFKEPQKGDPLTKEAAQFLAWSVAWRGAGFVSPNPLVGAVLVDQKHCYISCGAHLKAGSEHAEINALNQVKDPSILNQATLYVTLEPCAHHGKTAPCADAIAKLPLQKVIYGIEDPNPQVQGRGLKLLKDHGITVASDPEWSVHCSFLARVFLHNQKRNDVFCAMKVASTKEGIIGGLDTKRLWITGERARMFGHFLRLEYDAIAVGPKTVTLDDPMLDMRHPKISGRRPLPVLLDPKLQLVDQISSLRVYYRSGGDLVLVIPKTSVQPKIPPELNIKLIESSLDSSGYFDWNEIKRSLWDLGVRSLLIEGGAGVYKTLLHQKSVQMIHWFVSPQKISEGLKWEPIPKAKHMLESEAGLKLGEDLLFEIHLDEGNKSGEQHK